MDNQFTNSISFGNSEVQQSIMESMIISQNYVSNILPQERQEMKSNSGLFNNNNNIVETITEDKLKITKNETQIVEEEDYINAKSIYRAYSQENEGKLFDKFDGVPEIIDINTIKTKYTRYMQLKLNQDENIQKKKNLPDQIYESDGKLEVLVGRSKINNQIVLTDEINSISSSHALFYWKEDKQSWYLNDKNSKNGSYVVIDNSPVKENDKIAIGLYICTIESIRLDLTKNFFRLSFKCMVDDSIQPFFVERHLLLNEKLIIGKSHQPQLKDDPMIAENQCYIQYSKEKHKIKIWNYPEVEFKIAKILQPGKSVKIKNNDLIRLGLVNFYTFSQFTRKVEMRQPSLGLQSTQSEGEECCICQVPTKSIYILNPCNHSGICLECILGLEAKQKKCPICQALFKDYIVKK